MNNIKKRFTVTISGILTVLLLPLEMAHAAPADEMGCIARQQGSMKFVRSDQLDRQTIMETVKTQQLQGAKAIDPCLTGQVRNIPASVYAKLAEKYPEKFQPLGNSNQSNALPTKTVPGAALGIAPQYRYVDISETFPPNTFLFTAAFTNASRVYGTFFEFLDEAPFVSLSAAVIEHGVLTVLQGSKGIFATTANESGTFGGSVITDFENFFGQAALFDGSELQLIPRLPGEIHSEVLKINDPGVAIIFSLDENFNGRLALYKNGQVTPLDFGPDIQSVSVSGMNNQGIIVGITSIDGLGDRGFRFDPRTGVATLLEPLSTESHSWAVGINNRGNVLGYSFEFGAIERIGVWDAVGKFHTYFVEGIPEFPTISNRLRFNDNNMIVITLVTNPPSERGNSYLVPKPGVRLNVADLVTGVPHDLFLPFFFLEGINNHGNILGGFLLERIGLGTP